jgi:hypothetical protein
VTHPAQHTAAIHDVMAAELLASAARVDPEANELKNGINTLLGTAYIHRKRGERLSDAAVQATLGGAHDAAAVIGRTAAEELEAAAEHEAVVMGAVRGMHAFGFMTADEQKFIQRKKFEEGMTSGQAEDVFSKMLDNMFQSAVNYGVDDDGFGAEGEADEPDELEEQGSPIAQMGMVFAALGGDFPLVFGEDAYARFGVVFGASVDKLVKRRLRLRNRLKKLQEKLEKFEEAGKSGLRVRFLQRRVDKLEKRIEKISGKIKAAGGTKAAADGSEEESDEVKTAEESASKSASKGGDDDAELDSIEALATDLDGDESETDEGDDEKDGEDDDEISGLVAEVSLFGASERRSKRLRRRLIKMEARLTKLTKRRRGLLKNIRVRRLRKRIDALRAKLEGMDEDLPSTPSAAPGGGSYISALTSPMLKGYTADQYIKSHTNLRNVSLNVLPEIAEREPYVQFFRRQAESMGSLNIDMDSFGGVTADFFKNIGTFLKETFTAKGREARRVRQGRSQEYLQTRAANIQAKRAALTTARQSRREEISKARSDAEANSLEGREARGFVANVRRDERKDVRQARQDLRAARRAKPPGPANSADLSAAPPTTYQQQSVLSPGLWLEGNSMFVVDGDGKIYLVKPGRTEAQTKLILIPNQAGARRNLTASGTSARKVMFSSGRRWRDASGNEFFVSDEGELYLDSSARGKLPNPVRVPKQGLAQMNLLNYKGAVVA